MSKALRIFQGSFGRVALLDMDGALIHHAHPHCHVLIKASGADTFFAVRDRLHPLRDDTAVLVNTWEPHSYAHQPGAPATTILALYIEPRWLADRMANELLFTDEAGERHEQALMDLMVALIDRFSEWRSLRGAGIAARLPASDFRVRNAVRYMRSTLGEEFNADKVAQAAGLSRAHLFRLFHGTMQITPALYFNVLRMETAIGALADGSESVTTLSDRLGFAAPSHFSRFFRNNQGVTPTEYRRVVNLVDRAVPGPA